MRALMLLAVVGCGRTGFDIVTSVTDAPATDAHGLDGPGGGMGIEWIGNVAGSLEASTFSSISTDIPVGALAGGLYLATISVKPSRA